MCGIVGAVDPGRLLGPEPVVRCNEAQHHRGPDAAVVVEHGPFVLGNTRLAIQDPTDAGNQPFRHPELPITVVFNGEIYNFRELIARHRLDVHTGCDGEILPLLWAAMGPSCLHELRGMFAIAIVDGRVDRLYLARDGFGIKPLHWRRVGEAIVFSSEAAPLWRLDRSPALNLEAIAEFFSWGAVGAMSSPYDGIAVVAPGACVSFGADAAGPRTELVVPPVPLDLPATSSLVDALDDTVRAHLVADVPTALLLSAGLDSTFIARAACNLGQRLHCLTVTGEFGVDESLQAAATAREYGHDHERVPATLDAEVVEQFLRAMDRPSIDGLNTFVVCRAVRAAGFKVALSGLGGDEALGGYAHTQVLPWLRALRAVDRLPDRLVTHMADRLAGPGSKRARLLAPGGPRTAAGVVRLQRELLPPSTVARLVGTPVAESIEPTGDDYRSFWAEELDRYLRPMLLADADAFSMASSVELRVPFVDRPFVTAALARRRLRGKLELVEALGDRYLSELARRPKTGFSVPMSAWLTDGPLRDIVADARRRDAPVWDHIDRDTGLALLDAAGSGARWAEAWSVAVLDGWLRRR